MPLTSIASFQLPATGGKTFNQSLKGESYILYCYPKDNTPGCSQQASQFRDIYPQFVACGYAIYGLSRDSLKSHENFKKKFDLPFELVSDTEEIACLALDVMKMKNMYGKQVRGIERSTFVIDGKGKILKQWRGVKVPGHAEEVLKTIQTL